MVDLRPTDIVQGRIDRISNSGNGMLDYGTGEISIGPVRPDAVGREIDAVVYDRDHAFCLTEGARVSDYDNAMRAQTRQLVNNPPSDCPGLGETITVEIEAINSSRHGPAMYRGIPVRVRNIPEAVTTGETVDVTVVRIEPDRILATGVPGVDIRGTAPEIGETFTATIAHRSHSGQGSIESFVDATINVGPIKEGTVGESVEAVRLTETTAYCLTDTVVDDGYDEAITAQIGDNAPFDLAKLRERREQSGDPPSISRIVRGDQVRDRTFRQNVVEAYDGTCAVCGQRLLDATSGEYFEVEAAHIYPVSGIDPADTTEGGPDTIKNGVALCRTHHWAFDNGWFTTTDDYRIDVVENQSIDGYDVLAPHDGERLHLPDGRTEWPAKHYLAAHREKVFSGT